MKIWAKVLDADKILRDTVFESKYSLTPMGYQKTLQEICYILDVSVPVSLPSHLKHFVKFHRIKYIPRDFIEDVDFTSFVLELVADKK